MAPEYAFADKRRAEEGWRPCEVKGIQEAEGLVGKRVIICEDEALTQMQVRMILMRAGLIVVGQAMSGEEAVKLALQERPDLVLMDVRMPSGMDGLDAARRILAEHKTCVVMLTANAGYKEEAETIGACGYIMKPIDSRSIMPQLYSAYRKYEGRARRHD